MYYYLAAIVAFVSYFLYKCYFYPLYLSPLSKIPGPPVDNIILGHYSSLLNKDQDDSFFYLTKQYGGIVRFHSLFNKPFLLISDSKLIQIILGSRAYEFPRFVMNEALLTEVIGEGIIIAKEHSHKRQKKMLLPSFSFANVKKMIPTFVQTGHNLKDIWMKKIGNRKEERITVTDLISKVTLDIIGLVGFNYNFSSTTTECELAKAYKFITDRNQTPLFMALADLFPFICKLPTTDNNKYYDSIKIVYDVAEKILAELKNSPVRGTDFLSLVVNENDNLPIDEQLTHDELASLVMTILIAGHETTSIAFTWALYYLAKNPDTQDRLRKEILDIFPDRDCHPTFDQIEKLTFLECVFKEVLRIAPPLTAFVRTNAKDETFNGYFIPKNTPFIIPVYAIHHDPSIWGDDAEHFNPSRWLNPELKSNITKKNFLPFSTGPQSCLGIRMSYLEFKSILIVLIRNLEFKLVEGFTFEKKFLGLVKPIPGLDLLVSKVNY